MISIQSPFRTDARLAEWQAVKDEDHAECGENGVQFSLKVKGLIPGGLYTIWTTTFTEPGLTLDYASFVGIGALGLPDGSQNSFVALQMAKQLAVVHPGGASVGIRRDWGLRLRRSGRE